MGLDFTTTGRSRLGEGDDRMREINDAFSRGDVDRALELQAQARPPVGPEPSQPLSTPVSDDVVPEEPDGGKTPQEASGGSQKDRRRVNRRRKPHTVTMLDDDWAEMVDAAGRHGIGVSEMLVELWHKRGRKLYG